LFTAPFALVLDALSFLVSGWWKSRITVLGRPAGSDAGHRERLPQQVLAGFKVIFVHPVIRSVAVAATIGAFAGQMQNVVFVLYLIRDLGLPEALVGLIIAISGVAGVVGGLIGTSLTARFGNGPTFILGMLLASLVGFVLASATGPLVLVLIVVALGQVLRGSGPTLYGMNQQTIRQTLIPAALLPRALATWRVLVYGVQPLGALAGGVLGEGIGLRSTLVISGVVMLIGTATAFFGPLRTMRTLSLIDQTER
jgi:predicted MFS family arabinose efflux permease